MIGFDMLQVLNGTAEPVKGFHPICCDFLHKPVGKCKIIAADILRIRIKIGKDIRNIHIVGAAPVTACVMQPGKRDTRFRHFLE